VADPSARRAPRASTHLAFDHAEDRSLRSRALWERVEIELDDLGRSALQIGVAGCRTCQDYGLTSAITPS
jgi:hypothetical protein